MNNSGNERTIPGSVRTRVDISIADFEASATQTLPLAFQINTTGNVSYRCVASGATITETFAGGVTHWIGAFDRIFHANTDATVITIVR